MKIKRILPAAAALLVISAMLTGCGASLKTARVASKFGSALKEQPVTSAVAEVNCVVHTEPENTETRFHTVVRARTDWDTERSYSDIATFLTEDGNEFTENMQCYSTGESGEEVRYVHVDSMDTWVRLENQIKLIDIDSGLILLLLDKVSQDTTLEMTENAGGGAQYTLGLRFSAEDIRDFALDAGANIPQEFLDCDLKGVSIPLKLEIEDKTFLPLSLQISLEGMNASVVQALARAFAKGREVEGLDLEIQELSLLITNFGYDHQEIPRLPKGAAENALDMKKVKEIQN